MGRYTQALRIRAITAELAIARAKWRWFGLGGFFGVSVAAFVAWLK